MIEPGVIVMLVEPVVFQASVLLPPLSIVPGPEINEVIVGGTITYTAALAFTDPAASMAVSVYVVLTAGTTVVEPLAEDDLNVPEGPGVMVMLVDPVVFHVSVLLAPASI